MLYLIYVTLIMRFVGAIQSSCYTCGVRYGLTLAIFSKPQEKFRLVINQSVGSCSVELIPEVGVVYPLFVIKGYLFYIMYVIYLCIVLWYYPLFVAICEIWLLRLTYGTYLVLFLKSGITWMEAINVIPVVPLTIYKTTWEQSPEYEQVLS